MNPARRVIILGIGASGTSFYCRFLGRAGVKSPTPHKGYMRFPTFETREGREINEDYIGESAGSHPYQPDLALAPASDEILARARDFVGACDRRYARWVFKDPRSTVTWEPIWSRFDWTTIVCVYRNPADTVRSMLEHHMPERFRFEEAARDTWLEYSRSMLAISDERVRFVRFPGDHVPLARALGRRVPLLSGFRKRALSGDTRDVPDWARRTWRDLEERRRQSAET